MIVTPTAVEFAAPLRGLGPHTSYVLSRVEGADGLYALRSIEGDVRLFLLDPSSVDDGYRPALPAAVLSEIGAGDDSELHLFVVANPAERGISLNLRAPIVVHRDSGLAAQVILEDQSYPIRALLTE